MNETDLNDRMNRYQKSTDAFFENIFCGSFGEECGGHSSILDFLGLYGFMAIILFKFFINMYKYIIINVKINSKTRIIKNVWLYFLVLSIINTTIFTNIMIMLFVIIPFLTNILYGRNENDECSMDYKHNISISS